MKLSLSAGVVAGMLALAAPALAAPANVTVRVEGANSTLVDSVRVLTTSAPVLKGGQPCSGTSAGGALERATGGNWEASYSQFGHFITSIAGEVPPGTTYWSLWVNRKFAMLGACALELQEGDEVLFFVDRCDDFDPATFVCRDQVFPLGLTAPANAVVGSEVQLTVVSYDPNGVAKPEAGARVTGPGVDVTTDAAGRASFVAATPGTLRLKAEKPGFARSEARELVVGTVPATTAPPDLTPPTATLLAGIADKQVLRRGPRALRGRFSADPSGIRQVKLRLTRRLGKKCWYFSGRQERFRGTRCGRGAYFAIGDRAEWSYLLPQRLPRGRYVLDAIAIDGAGNRTPLERGTTRVVFTVR
jgi:hypothetical protein